MTDLDTTTVWRKHPVTGRVTETTPPSVWQLQDMEVVYNHDVLDLGLCPDCRHLLNDEAVCPECLRQWPQ